MKMIVIAPAIAGDMSKIGTCVDQILEGKKPSDLFWGFFTSTQRNVSETLQAVMSQLALRDTSFKEKMSSMDIDNLSISKRGQAHLVAKKIHGRRILDHNAINLIIVGPDVVNRLVPALTWNEVRCVNPSKPLEGYIVHLNGYVRSFSC